jgi:HK97 family phage prohead protease
MTLITRLAPFRAGSFDARARTVEVVWSAGAPVERIDWRTGETYLEELEMSAEAVNLDRLNGGAPVLNSHQSHSLENQIGVVERAWLADGQGVALIRFSERASVADIVADVAAGIIRNVSVGYSVERWSRGERDGRRVLRAERWTPHEVSLVPVPADAEAQVRAVAERTMRKGENIMADDMIPAAAAADEAGASPVDQERARIASLEDPLADAAKKGLDDAALRVLRRRAIAEGWTAEFLRAQLFDAIPIRAAVPASQCVPVAPVPTAQVGHSWDDPAVRIDAMATALARSVRANAAEGVGQDMWRQYRGVRPSDLVIELATARGERVSSRDRNRLIERAFHTTSDFPQLLSTAANKLLNAGYAAAAPSYRQVFARRSFNDFKPHSFISAGDFPALKLLNEGAEIEAGTISEKRETVTPATYARQLRVTRQMLVNDDLGAFLDMASLIGPRIADFENATAYALLNTANGDGPTLIEGNAAVFTTGRSNKASSAAAVTEASVAAGFTAMMQITTLDGLKANIQPEVLLCSPIQRFAALKLATSTTPSAVSGANPLAGLFRVVVDANIPNNRWYLFANPAAAPVYVYGYVGDADGPMIREGQPLGYDAVVFDVLLDFGVGAIDWRGAYFNPGAAPS